ncbi:MAG: VCBS repeat-containing protein, partial [bacterium]|nr:VCBS repeat-containing protein [bacterium]
MSKRQLRIVVAVVFLCVCVASLTPAAQAQGTIPARGYRVAVTVDEGAVTAPHAPFSVDIDFGALLTKAGATDSFAPNSVVVMRVGADGTETLVPHAMAEGFNWADTGAVSWAITRPADRTYHVYFDVLAKGPFAPPAYIALVGNGDCPRYNRPDGEDPIHAHAFLPISADFNNDGTVDLVSRQIYSSAWGQPWFTIWFWANIGTNEKPVYADYVRLQADGEVIPNHYSGCDLFDWDNDGLLDLVTSKSVYRNTGKVTHTKTP